MVGKPLTLTLKARDTMLLLVPPSFTVTVITAEPKAPEAGAKESKPAEFGLRYVICGEGINAGLLEAAVTVNTWLSFVAPELIPERATVWVPEFWLIVRFGSGFNVGA